MRKLSKDKRGVGVVSGTITAIIGLVITVVVGYLIIDTVLGANLLVKLSDGNQSAMELGAGNLSTNLTQGVGNVALKIPTILLITAVVFLFGALALLVLQARRMGMFGNGGGF